MLRQHKEKFARYLAKNQGGEEIVESTVTEGDTTSTLSEQITLSKASTTPSNAVNSSFAGQTLASLQANEHDSGDPRVVRVIAGTFGNRQGMRVIAECGPFFHMLSC